MAKTLKLGFAMGGGVSLGSFSGAGLTESIKLAILYGVDEQGERFEKVEIDVFSGASAGAMSLGVMLKALAFPEQDEVIRAHAWQTLKHDYQLQDDTLSSRQRSQLIDAELAQQLLNTVWVDDISLDKLLSPAASGKVPPLKYQAGICNKAAVTDIAKMHMSPPPGNYTNAHQSVHPLLAPRVLYGCSISNVNPLHADARSRYLSSPNSNVAAKDALTSNFHREQRIFDINFVPVDSDKFANDDIHPKRWMRFHWGDAISHLTYDIRDQDDWKHIIATAVASGAFPVAFEPVPLTRYKWEYPPGMWEFGEQSRFVFSYMDGGVFSNSPVAEAFKLASHVDGSAHIDPDNEPADYERRIIYVDPFVGDANRFNLKGLKQFKDQTPIGWLGNLTASADGNDLLKLTSLDKLIPNGMNQLAAIHAQASAQYQHRNFQIANKLVMRNRLRELLKGQITATESQFNHLREELSDLLVQFSDKALVPTLPARLADEIERLAREKHSLLAALKGQGEAIAGDNWASLSTQQRDLGMLALLFSYIDLIADLEAKSRNSQLVAIGPFKFTRIAGETLAEKIFLPGGALAGFAGFMSPLPSAYEVEVARFCSFQMLQDTGLIPADQLGHKVNQYPGPFTQQAEFDVAFKFGLKQLGQRLGEAVEQSNLINVGWFNSVVLNAVKGFVESAVNALPYQDNSEEFEFRIDVSDKQFELDGKGWADKDRQAVRLENNGDKRYLVCFASRNWDVPDTAADKDKWQGYFLENGKLAVDRDAWSALPDRDFVEIAMPADRLLRQAAKMANPIFYSKQSLHKNSAPTQEELEDFWQLCNEITPYTDLL